jgi:ubiquinone/menaquinone biosynthesis C-methylase UbiE
VRDAAFQKLELSERPLTVYDVGCGAGFDTVEIAKRLSAGMVVGVDISSALLEEAKARCVTESLPVPVDFILGDARTLTTNSEIPTRSADRVYMERALQHIPRWDLEAVLQQFHSVLARGGIFVSVEPNWELFTVRSDDVSFFRKLHHHWVDRFNHGNVAMNVPDGMRRVGFTDVTSEVLPVEFTSFDDGELVYDFTRTANELVDNGTASASEASAWLSQQRQAGESFYCCLMMTVTSGRRV